MGRKKRQIQRKAASKPKQSLCVGILAGDGFVSVELMDWLMPLFMVPDLALEVVTINQHSPVAFARNVLARRFVDDCTAERLLMLDADMLPTKSAYEMLKVDADIVSGRAFVWDIAQGRRFLRPCLFRRSADGKGFVNGTPPKAGEAALWEADAAGTGCLMVKRKVLEDKRLWLDPKFEGPEGNERDANEENPEALPIFRTLWKPNGKPARGEDLDFTWRAKQLGYRIVAHWGAEFGHRKQVNLDEVADLAATCERLTAQKMYDAGWRPSQEEAS